MVNDAEINILLVSSTTLMLALVLLRRLALLPGWRLLLASFLLYFAATVATVLEGFLLPDLFNAVEHLCRTLFPVPVIAWAVRARRQTREGAEA